MRGTTNYFAGEEVAERYTRSRPYFHPQVVRRIGWFLRLQEPVDKALDVACGTGQSAVALTEIASRVVGSDSSTGMLARSPRHDRIEYVEASAEDLPFATNSFDLVTVALAFHWFDRSRFLSEAWRVLRRSGWLVVYDNRFFGRMKENTAFEPWIRNHYLVRYPSPPRDTRSLTQEEAQGNGFSFVKREDYTNEVRFSVEELAEYLETQSNVIAAVEEGKESIEEAHEWLVNSLVPLFPGPSATFEFGGDIWYLEAA